MGNIVSSSDTHPTNPSDMDGHPIRLLPHPPEAHLWHS